MFYCWYIEFLFVSSVHRCHIWSYRELLWCFFVFCACVCLRKKPENSDDTKGVIKSHKLKVRQHNDQKIKGKTTILSFSFDDCVCLSFDLRLLITPLISSFFFTKKLYTDNSTCGTRRVPCFGLSELYINRKYTTSKLKHLFYRKISFVTGNHSNFPGVGQDVNNIYHYL